MSTRLAEIVILNESPDPEIPRHVSLFASRKAAASYTEPIDVHNNEYHAISAEGRILRLETDGDNVTINDADTGSIRKDIVRRLLTYMVDQGYRASGDAAAPKIEATDATIEELVAFVGFVQGYD